MKKLIVSSALIAAMSTTATAGSLVGDTSDAVVATPPVFVADQGLSTAAAVGLGLVGLAALAALAGDSSSSTTTDSDDSDD